MSCISAAGMQSWWNYPSYNHGSAIKAFNGYLERSLTHNNPPRWQWTQLNQARLSTIGSEERGESAVGSVLCLLYSWCPPAMLCYLTCTAPFPSVCLPFKQHSITEARTGEGTHINTYAHILHCSALRCLHASQLEEHNWTWDRVLWGQRNNSQLCMSRWVELKCL